MVNLQTYYYTKTQIDTLLNGKSDSNHTHSQYLTSQSLNDYVTTSDSRLSDARTPTSHTHGNITNDGKIGSDSGKIITTGANGVLTASSSITKSLISDFPTSMTPTSHEHSSSDVKDNSAYSNIGSSANATQKTINDKINTELGLKANSNNVYSKSETYTQSEITTLISNAVSNLQLFEVVSELPSTNIKSNRLYLIVNGESITNNSYDIYLRVDNAWEQLDSLEFDISNFYNKTEVDTLLNGKVDTSDSRLTDTRTPKSHTHGDITNTGTIGSTSNLPLITTTNGKIATGSFGTSANTFCQGNDSRLSDARTPTSHTHTKSQITDFPTIPTKTSDLTNDADGTTGVTYVKSNDSRLTDARTPTSHTHTKSQITDFPTIPSASSSTPSADVSGGAVGSSSNYAKADHQHPLSSVYATNGHTHTGMLTSSDVGTSSDTSSSKIVACNDTRLSDARTPTSHTHTKSQITDFPTIPSASSTTPSADTTSGSYGSGTAYARANHTHPKSSLYAEASHNQVLSTITDASTVSVVVTYTDDTTEILDLVVWGGATIATNVVLTQNERIFTATVTNAKGNGISGKTVTFYNTNNIMGTATTNNNGVATYTYPDLYLPPLSEFKAVCDSVESNVISY